MTRVILACVLVLCCSMSVAADNCLTPPTLSYSVRMPARLNYKIVGSGWTDEQKVCVSDAFWTWNTALRQSQHRIQFRQVSIRAAQITVMRAPLAVNVGGGLVDTRVDENGHFKSTGLAVTSYADVVSSCAGIYKIVLHEIGHILGLADMTYNKFSAERPVPSVMNTMGGANDEREFIPTFPTSCDVAAVPHL
jgi:hypothetical protein